MSNDCQNQDLASLDIDIPIETFKYDIVYWT